MNDGQIKHKKIVFVVGVGRSGTTWLQNILAHSPNVATAPETHLFDSYLRSLIDSRKTFQGAKVGLSHIVGDEEVCRWMGSFVGMCLQKISDRRPEAKIVLDKTPSHSRRTRDILKALPDCYFVHMVRDPRAVVVSMRAASDSWGSRWAPRSLKDACRVWQRDLGQAQATHALTHRYREVRYEQLHADGPGEIVRLFEWLGEPIERAEAAEYVAASTFENMRSSLAAPLKAGNVEQRFFRRGEVDSWQRDLSGSDIAIIERLTRNEMARLGYRPISGWRDRAIARARLRAYKAGVRLEAAAHNLSEFLKP